MINAHCRRAAARRTGRGAARSACGLLVAPPLSSLLLPAVVRRMSGCTAGLDLSSGLQAPRSFQIGGNVSTNPIAIRIPVIQ